MDVRVLFLTAVKFYICTNIWNLQDTTMNFTKRRLITGSDNIIRKSSGAIMHDPLSNFDPMSEHYYSDQNNFVAGGNFDANYNSKGPKRSAPIGKLFIRNIPEDLTERGLKNIFSLFGDVIFCCLRTSQDGFQYGLINYKSIDIAMAAIHGLHLKQPHKLSIKFSNQSKQTKTKEIESSTDTVIAKPPPPTCIKPKLPSILSDARKKFLQSDLYKGVEDPTVMHNNYITRLSQCPKSHTKRYEAHRAKILSLSDEEIKTTFEVNPTNYRLCSCCSEPAVYCCAISSNYYCSLYCQENMKDIK